MDGHRFDRITRRLAQSPHSRRETLKRGGLGLVATALASAGLVAQNDNPGGEAVRAASLAQGTPAATPAAENPNELEIEGAWLCNQTFALCTTAPCERSTSNDQIANCRCFVENGYSIGFTSCADRAQSGNNLVSNFSTINVNSAFRTMTCPENAPWANCLDVPCEINPINPGEALCQCEMVESGPSLTFGGGCDTSTCTSVIWSAAPPTYLGLAQYEAGMKQVNQTVTLPPTCPSATPVATPASS